MTETALYQERRTARSQFVSVRGLRHHVLSWGDAALATPERPPLVMLHGWMDVAASFQFVVDALPSERHVVALDWRGFGLTDTPAGDTYWIPDYVGDLDALLDALLPRAPDRPARPQHGRQRRHDLRGPAARAASAGSSTWKASACRARGPSRRRGASSSGSTN